MPELHRDCAAPREIVTRTAVDLMLTAAVNLKAGGFATISPTAQQVQPDR